ncbi:MAG: signal peptidase I [Vicinamibacterales bacterium]
MSGLPRWVLGARPRRTAGRAAVLVLASLVLFGYVLLPVRGVGVSMQPTIAPGEFLLVSTLTYRWRAPRAGDIVAVRLAGRSVVYVKRLVALPGQTVAFDEGRLVVDGRPQAEPYVVERAPWRMAAARLGPDQYFVVGDNRGMPRAQHDMGVVDRARLVGTVVF